MLDKRLTFILKPLDDETLTSLFIRFATLHGLTPSDLVSIIFGKKASHVKELEYHYYTGSKLTTKALTNTFGISEQAFWNTMDFSLLKNFGQLVSQNAPFVNGTLSGTIHGILRLKSSTRNQNGTQYCDICLKEDKIPYFRKKWKLSFNTLCEKHNKLLMDTCPKCNKYITLWVRSYREYYDNVYLSRGVVCVCSHCGFDLRKSKTDLNQQKELKITNLQRNLYTGVDSSWFGTSKPSKEFPAHFFPVLYRLLRIFSFESKGKYLKMACDYFGLEVPDIFDSKAKNFDNLDVEQRHQIVHIVCKLLQPFPDSLIDFACNDYELSRFIQVFSPDSSIYWKGWLLEDIEYVPDWFYSALTNKFIRTSDKNDWMYMDPSDEFNIKHKLDIESGNWIYMDSSDKFKIKHRLEIRWILDEYNMLI